MGWLRYSLLFSLLHTIVQSIQGARFSIGLYVSALPPLDLVRVESSLSVVSVSVVRKI